MESYDILVIVLSGALLVSLGVWIFVGVVFIKVLNKVKVASDSARAAVEHVEEFTAQLKNVGKMSAWGSIIGQAAKAFKSKKKG